MAMKKCKYCDRKFTGRSDAKFCNNNFGRCRGAYHRLKKRAAELNFNLPDNGPVYVFDLDVLTALKEGFVSKPEKVKKEEDKTMEEHSLSESSKLLSLLFLTKGR